MTVEALIFIVLGLIAIGFILKAASTSSPKQKSGLELKKSIGEKSKLSGPLPDNGHALDSDIITKELEVVHARRDAAPTAELQAIGDIDAFQRAQILVDKGQIIEAVKYLCDNAGYDMKKAVDAVDSMGKKMYPAD